MADIPYQIVLKRDRDLAGRGSEIWIRRILFLLPPLAALLALLDVFGQRPISITRSGGGDPEALRTPARAERRPL